MIHRYCDCCGEEITDTNRIRFDHERLRGEIRSKRGHVLLRVEVITAMNGTWNAGDFCKYCVLDALYAADDRVRGL